MDLHSSNLSDSLYDDDIIKEIDNYRSKFETIKNLSKEDMIIQRNNPEFYKFLKKAFYYLQKNKEFLNFCINLELNDFYLDKFEMKDFFKNCKEEENKIKMNVDEIKIKKRKKRISFNLEKNQIKYFVPEETILNHKNYLEKDKKEALICKDIWLNPVQIKQFISYKLKSLEILNQKKRLQNTVFIKTNNDFVPIETESKNLLQNVTRELSIISLNLKNNLIFKENKSLISTEFNKNEFIKKIGLNELFLKMIEFPISE